MDQQSIQLYKGLLLGHSALGFRNTINLVKSLGSFDKVVDRLENCNIYFITLGGISKQYDLEYVSNIVK